MFHNAIFMNTLLMYGLNFKYYIFYIQIIIITFDKNYLNYVNITFSSSKRSFNQETSPI
jgi:hypothetical protein